MDKLSQAIALHGKLVDTACASETKRQSVSVTSAALISAGAGWVGSDRDFVLTFLILPLMTVSAIWFVTVRYYQQLAKAKWAVIHEIENELQFQPFKREWQLYQERKQRFTFGPSTVEQVVPALIFLAAAFYGLTWLIRVLFY